MSNKHKYFDNIDVSENRQARGGWSANAAFGDIPQDVINTKYEQTDLFEDPNELHNYHRGMLKYTGPDPENYEDEGVRRDNHSEERLNLRHGGARSEFKPYHPDAFFGFTEADPRGTSLDPDMRKLVDQSRFRGKYIRFYNDDDPSVPESGRNEQQVLYDKRKGFYWVKDRMKVFSTSKDGRAAGRPMGKKGGQDIAYVTDDGQLKDLNYGRAHINRGDKTTILSNYLPIGWYKTTDHDFKVASYGIHYQSMDAGDIDLRRIKGYTRPDHSELVEYRDSILPKAIVQKMKRIATERTEHLPAHFQLSLEEKIRKRQRVTRPKKTDTTSVAVDQDIVEAMVVSSKRANTNIADASGAVKWAAENTEKTRTNNETRSMAISTSHGSFKRDDGKLRRKATVKVEGEERMTKDYTGLKPLKNRSRTSGNTHAEMKNYDGENYDVQVNHRRPGYVNVHGTKKLMNSAVNGFTGDGQFRDSQYKNRSSGRLENKSNSRNLADGTAYDDAIDF